MFWFFLIFLILQCIFLIWCFQKARSSETALFSEIERKSERDTLRSRSFSLTWVFAFTKSFASLVSRVVSLTQRINKAITSGILFLIAGVQDPEAFCYSNPQAKSIHTLAATTANICRRWIKLLVDVQTYLSLLTILSCKFLLSQSIDTG